MRNSRNSDRVFMTPPSKMPTSEADARQKYARWGIPAADAAALASIFFGPKDQPHPPRASDALPADGVAAHLFDADEAVAENDEEPGYAMGDAFDAEGT
jgi:hypothetical protein